MDTRTGRIYSPEEVNALFEKEEKSQEVMELIKHIQPMQESPTPKQMRRKPPKVGRNEPCPCGSGKKLKKCCLGKAPKGNE